MRPDAAALRAQAETCRNHAVRLRHERRTLMRPYLDLLDEMMGLDRDATAMDQQASELEAMARRADAADRWERRASERMGRAA